MFFGVDGSASCVPWLQDDLHLHGVPATTLVEAKHPAFCYWDHKERKKLGSFQEFVRHDMVGLPNGVIVSHPTPPHPTPSCDMQEAYW